MQCKNCHSTIEASQNYCYNCGAKRIRNRLSPSVLLKQINKQFLSVDNKFLKTFIGLFKSPETVINNYINGTRKAHIDVLQYLAIALTLVGLQVFLMNTFFKDELNATFTVLESMDPASKSTNPFKSFEDINRYQSIIYIITIPFYALATWTANLIIKPNFAYNFTEHLVVNIYYYSQIIIITAITSILFLCFGLDYLVISGIVSILIFAYQFYVLKRVFNLDFWYAIAFFLLVMVCFVIIGIIIGLLAIIFGFLYAYIN